MMMEERGAEEGTDRRGQQPRPSSRDKYCNAVSSNLAFRDCGGLLGMQPD